MKKHFTLTLLLSLMTLGCFAQNHTNNNNGQIHWYTDYNAAVQEAQKENIPLFLFFTGSDWCGWCKKMQQEIFDTPAFINEVGNDFVFVELDFPMNTQLPSNLSQQNTMLKQKFGITGYPTVIILSPDQSFIAEAGYRPGGGQAYASFIKQLASTPSHSY